MPSWELFAQQDEAYRRKILPRGNVRIGIEAAGSMGWDRWLSGERGDSRKSAFIGMEGFGASAPAPELYEHFGITAERAVEMAKSLM
jgi:transketolase